MYKLRNCFRHFSHCVVGVFGAERYSDVQTTFARRFTVVRHAAGIEHAMNDLRDFYHLGKTDIDGIKIKNHPVRFVEVPYAAIPRIHFKTAQIGEINESRFVLADDIVDLFVSGLRMDFHSFYPAR